jgi:DNA polymerase-1
MLLVDAPNHAFRAYHAIQNDMRAPDGFPTRCLYGFTRMLLALARDQKPDYVAFVFDARTSFRNELYPAYKGQRPDMPEDLRAQWPELAPLIEAFGYTVLRRDHTEADDIIGTLATRFAGEDLDVAIVSSDKDFCQLVNGHVTVLDLMKGVELDRAGVVERWGVPPERVIDLLALMGDSSDNVPGVPGVGEKKAAGFLARFGDLDGVLANAAAIGGKTGEAVAAHVETVRLARQLVTIDTHVPIEVRLEDLAPRPRDTDALRTRLHRYNFRSLSAELGLGAPQVATPHMTWTRVDSDVAWGPGPLADLAARLRAAGRFALDPVGPGNTGGATGLRGRLDGLAFAWEEEGRPRAVRVPWEGAAVSGEGHDALAAVLGDPAVAKAGYDLKETLKLLHAHGLSLEGVADDPLLADYVLQPESRHYLDDLSKRHLEHALDAAVPGERAVVAWRLAAELRERVAREGLDPVYRDLELPLLPVLARMEIAGIGVDVDGLRALGVEFDRRITEVAATIHAAAGRTFNIGSTQQLAAILFDELKLQNGKKTKTGWSTDAETLENIGDQHPLPGLVLQWRELSKLRSTYVEALPLAVHPSTGRIHTTFRQAVAATGRLSSQDPNLQNIPVRTEEGRRIRRCFVARPGHVFVSCDYSQVELRLLAHYAGHGPLVESFLAGEDIHRRTAGEIFGVMPALVTAEQRRAAKAINFGIIYGMGAWRLANELGIPRGEAARYIEGYFARYPQVREVMDGACARAREKGYAETLFGRRRPVPELDARNPADRAAAERIAINTPIQGSAADIIKRAMLVVDGDLRPGGALAHLGATLLLQVHDELLLEVPEAHAETVAHAVGARMAGVAALRVPLVVDHGIGRTWEDAHG